MSRKQLDIEIWISEEGYRTVGFPPEKPESGAYAGEVRDQAAGRNSAGRPQSGTADLHIFGIGEQSFSWLWVLICKCHREQHSGEKRSGVCI